jgi:hypothetical protein
MLGLGDVVVCIVSVYISYGNMIGSLVVIALLG